MDADSGDDDAVPASLRVRGPRYTGCRDDVDTCSSSLLLYIANRLRLCIAAAYRCSLRRRASAMVVVCLFVSRSMLPVCSYDSRE